MFGADPTDLPDFGALSLDQLANIKITSFTGKQQKLSQVAGAVYVITQEQIGRSGLTSVPELLRLAPGVDVARVNGNQWSISARGMTGVWANKLLVLIDGRSIYSAIFSGVFWDLGMPLIDDIDRIEVIRGPGATVWGANAVLGVINIITKSSRDTHGTTITAAAGSSQRAFGSVSTSGATGSTNYRVYVGGSDNAPMSQQSGASANDAWSSLQAGFRLDGSYKKNTWMLEGDLFRGAENETAVNPSIIAQAFVESPSRLDTFAGSLTGELRRRVGDTGEFRIQSYYAYADRPVPQTTKAMTSTWDTEFRYDVTKAQVHHLSVGAGERLISENMGISTSIGILEGLSFPAGLTYSNLNAFVQDEMHLAHDSVLVTAGAKLERNHFGGWQPEPSVNLLWMPGKHHSVWISAARSLRTPSFFDVAVEGPFLVYPASEATGGLPVSINFVRSPGFLTEAVSDFEAGYRGELSPKFTVDLSVFYDRFSSLKSFLSGDPAFAPSPVPHLDVPFYTQNDAGAVGKGGEGSLAWQVLPKWKLEGSYTYVLINPWLTSAAPPGAVLGGADKQPSRNKWRLQSYLNLSKAWKLDTFLYWGSPGSPANNLGPDVLVPAYTRLDVRLGYHAGPRWQLSLAGQNLLQARHLEGLSSLLTAYSYVNREVYLKSTWQF